MFPLSEGEPGITVDAAAPLTLTTRGNVVSGTNSDLDEPLPLMTPPHATFGADVHAGRSGRLFRPHFGAAIGCYAERTRLNSGDVPIAAYTVVDVFTCAAVPFGARSLRIALEVRNPFDTAYRSFQGRYSRGNPGRAS